MGKDLLCKKVLSLILATILMVSFSGFVSASSGPSIAAGLPSCHTVRYYDSFDDGVIDNRIVKGTKDTTTMTEEDGVLKVHYGAYDESSIYFTSNKESVSGSFVVSFDVTCPSSSSGVPFFIFGSTQDIRWWDGAVYYTGGNEFTLLSEIGAETKLSVAVHFDYYAGKTSLWLNGKKVIDNEPLASTQTFNGMSIISNGVDCTLDNFIYYTVGEGKEAEATLPTSHIVRYEDSFDDNVLDSRIVVSGSSSNTSITESNGGLHVHYEEYDSTNIYFNYAKEPILDAFVVKFDVKRDAYYSGVPFFAFGSVQDIRWWDGGVSYTGGAEWTTLSEINAEKFLSVEIYFDLFAGCTSLWLNGKLVVDNAELTSKENIAGLTIHGQKFDFTMENFTCYSAWQGNLPEVESMLHQPVISTTDSRIEVTGGVTTENGAMIFDAEAANDKGTFFFNENKENISDKIAVEMFVSKSTYSAPFIWFEDAAGERALDIRWHEYGSLLTGKEQMKEHPLMQFIRRLTIQLFTLRQWRTVAE